MILVYPHLTVMFFKFLFICKEFFCARLFSNDIPYLAKLRQRKVTTTKWRKFYEFHFILFWKLVFMCEGSQPRTYTDLFRFQSRVKEPIHIIILMKSIIQVFIHTFHVLTCLQTRKIKE